MRHAEALYSGNKLSIHYYMVIKYVRDKCNFLQDLYSSSFLFVLHKPLLYKQLKLFMEIETYFTKTHRKFN